MILYHWTRQKFVPSIMESGLLAGDDPKKSAPILTLCIPVVWLTKNSGAPDWMLQFHKDAVRLTIDVKKKRAIHWVTWLQDSEARCDGGEVIRGVDVWEKVRQAPEFDIFGSDAPNFYIHFGRIPARRIKTIERIEWCCDDADAASLTEHQAQLSA
jgi:hypothetical protein